jgi:hypothetical protein
MADIAKICGMSIDDIAKINGRAIADISKVCGLLMPSGSPDVAPEWLAWDYDPFNPLLDGDMLVTQIFEG